MGKGTKYVAKVPDENGHIHYTEEENQIWHELITRQKPALPGRACKAYINALNKLAATAARAHPQTGDV